MDKLVRHIKFPLTFDVHRLKEDLDKVFSKKWTAHYNTGNYSGNWTSVALMSQNGKSDSIYALPSDDGKLIATDALEICDYFKEVLDGFPFEKTAVRLLQLEAGAEVKPHTDNDLGYEDGSFRLHIPIVTNSEVEFILDGNRLDMKEGECWYINANFTHSVVNRGTVNRVHLVIDGLQNDWTDEMFYNEVPKENFDKPKPVISDEQKQLMIAELKRMNSPVAEQLLKELEQ